METLKDQAIARIRQWGLPHLTDALVDLLRPSIRLGTRPAPEEGLEMGASRFGGTPDLPPGLGWPARAGQPLPFYAQIHCADLAASDVDGILPHEGWLYFFYDVMADESGSPVKHAPQPDTWRVFYVPDERTPLQRAPFPAALSAWERYGCCALTYAPDVMLPDLWSSRLERLGRAYLDLGPDSREWGQYQDLLDTLDTLVQRPAGPSYHRMLGYPDEDGDRMEAECERRSAAVGWHQPSSDARRDWVLLLQIDANQAERDGAKNMMKGDWLAIYFWMRREALARRQFEQVWVLVNAD
jgi:uncharacterized protein YwqG